MDNLGTDSYIQVRNPKGDGLTYFRPAANFIWIRRQLLFFTGGVSQKRWRSLIQGAKIYFSHFQVIGSFINFRVPFPRFLQWNIQLLSVISHFLTLDIFRWPNLGCVVMLEFNVELVAQTVLPLVIVILMVVPVLVARLRLAAIPGNRHKLVANTVPVLGLPPFLERRMMRLYRLSAFPGKADDAAVATRDPTGDATVSPHAAVAARDPTGDATVSPDAAVATRDQSKDESDNGDKEHEYLNHTRQRRKPVGCCTKNYHKKEE